MSWNKVIVGILAAGISAPVGVSAGEPGGTPDDLFFTEAAVGTSAGILFFVGGYVAGGDAEKNAGTTREKISLGVYAAAPLATALGAYVTGETRGIRSRNRAAVWLATTGVCYGLTAAAAGATYLLSQDQKKEAAISASLYAVFPGAFLAAAVYNAAKEPYFAPLPGYSRGEVGPALLFSHADEPGGRSCAIYGLSLGL